MHVAGDDNACDDVNDDYAQKGTRQDFLFVSRVRVSGGAAPATMLSIGPGETGVEDFFLETSIPIHSIATFICFSLHHGTK